MLSLESNPSKSISSIDLSSCKKIISLNSITSKYDPETIPTMKTLCSTLIILFFVGFTAIAQNAINVSGTWIMNVQTDAGSGSPTFVLKQDTEKITGSYTGQLGDSQVTGTLKGNVIHLEFSIQGNLITYDGTVASSTEMSGKVNLADMASGTFTGKKKS